MQYRASRLNGVQGVEYRASRWNRVQDLSSILRALRTNRKNLGQAVQAVLRGSVASSAARSFEVPTSTLHDALKRLGIKRQARSSQIMVFSRPLPILPRWDIGGRDAVHVTTIKQAATFVQYGWSIHKAAKSFGIKKGTLHKLAVSASRGLRRNSVRSYTEENIEKAMLMIKSGRSVRGAAIDNGIPVMSLYCKAKALGVIKPSNIVVRIRRFWPKTYQKPSKNQILAAISEVEKGFTIRQAAEKFDVSPAVVGYHMKKLGKKAQQKGRPKRAFEEVVLLTNFPVPLKLE
ncbi:hypothetical protein QYM36_010142 [Artemia franciscana]|uniref:HTH psq-type domain-containing protein n=1 Tax=Artemia franciscana TaxID=6661 RepID=A0AA88HSE4_ARTSF|nr:hypothetical protein QYM36_010142 [Artemia franciscana]